ncbi:MAG: hypothetical protein KF851_15225 [Pirellulaceae bacterium]|nr:hypothetical protein [Pirellulaceae bacterium]
MSIKVSCPKCQKNYKLKDEFSGKKIRCSACQTPFTATPADTDVYEPTIIESQVADEVPPAAVSVVSTQKSNPVSAPVAAPVAAPVVSPIAAPVAAPIKKTPEELSPYEAYAAGLLNPTSSTIPASNSVGGHLATPTQAPVSPYEAMANPHSYSSSYHSPTTAAKSASNDENGLPVLVSMGLTLILLGAIALILPMFGLQLRRFSSVGPIGGGIAGLVGSILVGIGFAVRQNFVLAALGSMMPGGLFMLAIIGILVFGGNGENGRTAKNSGPKTPDRLARANPPAEVAKPPVIPNLGNQPPFQGVPKTNPRTVPIQPPQPGGNPGRGGAGGQVDLGNHPNRGGLDPNPFGNQAIPPQIGGRIGEQGANSNELNKYADYNFKSESAERRLNAGNPPPLGLPEFDPREVSYEGIGRDVGYGVDHEQDLANEQGVMVGMVAHFDTTISPNPWVGLQPIYQKDSDYVQGSVQGRIGNHKTVLLAEHGHVVVAINCYDGKGVLLKTAPVVKGSVSSSNFSMTPIAGSEKGFPRTGTPGPPIVGIGAKIDSTWGGVEGIRLVRAKTRSAEQGGINNVAGNSNSTETDVGNVEYDVTQLRYHEVGDIGRDMSIIRNYHAALQIAHTTGVAVPRSSPAARRGQPSPKDYRVVGGATKGMSRDYRDAGGAPIIGLLVFDDSREGYLKLALPVFSSDSDYSVLCPDGYGLGALHVFADTNGVKGLQPIFMKISGKKFDTSDQLVGKWLGSEPVQSAPEVLGGKGAYVSGMRINDFSILVNIGLITND